MATNDHGHIIYTIINCSFYHFWQHPVSITHCMHRSNLYETRMHGYNSKAMSGALTVEMLNLLTSGSAHHFFGDLETFRFIRFWANASQILFQQIVGICFCYFSLQTFFHVLHLVQSQYGWTHPHSLCPHPHFSAIFQFGSIYSASIF